MSAAVVRVDTSNVAEIQFILLYKVNHHDLYTLFNSTTSPVWVIYGNLLKSWNTILLKDIYSFSVFADNGVLIMVIYIIPSCPVYGGVVRTTPIRIEKFNHKIKVMFWNILFWIAVTFSS